MKRVGVGVRAGVYARARLRVGYSHAICYTPRMPSPSIGRIVHFCPSSDADVTPVTLPAIITAVHSNDSVNLTIFHDGDPYTLQEVMRSDSLSPLPATWFWPVLH
jgi:hypothetical protein